MLHRVAAVRESYVIAIIFIYHVEEGMALVVIRKSFRGRWSFYNYPQFDAWIIYVKHTHDVTYMQTNILLRTATEWLAD